MNHTVIDGQFLTWTRLIGVFEAVVVDVAVVMDALHGRGLVAMLRTVGLHCTSSDGRKLRLYFIQATDIEIERVK